MDPWGKETILKVDGDHIQDVVVVVVVITSKRGLAEIRAWKDLTSPDIHVNPHEVVIGIEVHV